MGVGPESERGATEVGGGTGLSWCFDGRGEHAAHGPLVSGRLGGDEMAGGGLGYGVGMRRYGVEVMSTLIL